MPTLSLPIVAGFAASIIGQFVALALLPATRGFTAPWQTLVCVIFFVASIAISARLLHSGVELSMLTPIVTVTLQIFVLAVGVTVYGEHASPLKILLLVASAMMVAAATQL